jgi:hypothetical protein
MEIHDIKEVSDEVLYILDKLMNRDCQPGKFSLVKIKQLAKNTDILYIIEEDPVYFLLLDRFDKHKTVYIHDVCASKKHRGRGVFKESIAFLKKYYSKKGFKNFTLDASDSTKEVGLNQKARIHIFHSSGFDINTETGLFNKDGDYTIMKTVVLLDNGETVEIQKKTGDKYSVKNKSGKEYSITIEQIEKCFDSDGNQISCPMIMKIPKARRRKTLKK